MNRAFLSFAAIVALASPASAQVESASGAQVVYDPTTNTTRVTDPLFRPNAPAPIALTAAPIHLHMPRPHVVHHAPAVAAAAPVAPAETAMAAPAPTPAPAPEIAPPAKIAKAAPVAHIAPPQDMAPPAGPDAAIPFSLDSGLGDYTAPPTKTAKHGKTERVASAEPAPSAQDGKHIRVLFTAGATEPTPETAASLASVAANLNTSLRTSSDRVLLQSYGGAAGDKSSDSRRLCLKRALSVRQLLIDAGIPSDRIDVRAMGGAGVGDPPDRVDMIVHG